MPARYTLLILLFLTGSCRYIGRYPGFSKTGSGCYFKLHKIGEPEKTAGNSDLLTLRLSFRTMNDSLFFEGKKRIMMPEKILPGTFHECLGFLHQGDSASFIVPYSFLQRPGSLSSHPHPAGEDDPVRIDVSVVRTQSRKEYENEIHALLKWAEDMELFEKEILEQYVNQKLPALKLNDSGFYLLTLKKGNGHKIHHGDTITIHYEGRFLNGKFFDSTVKRKKPFTFVYGVEWQVVDGLEGAIGMMEEKQKCLCIFPSDMAFGSEGSETGIVPPYTSLMYEIEILEVN